jgi:hypothetical protein
VTYPDPSPPAPHHGDDPPDRLDLPDPLDLRERLDLHNRHCHPDTARAGQCGEIHLATGRICQLPARHPGSCRFQPAPAPAPAPTASKEST